VEKHNTERENKVQELIARLDASKTREEQEILDKEIDEVPSPLPFPDW
jgi:hypothetical protein